MSKLTMLCLVLAVQGATADQEESVTKCDATTPMSKFDITKIGGQWFVYEWSMDKVDPPNAICMMRTFTLSSDKTWFALHVDFMEDDGNYDADDYDYVLNINTKNPAILDVSDSFAGERQIVIDTDYVNYAITKNCFHIEDCETYLIMVMTREREPNDDIVDSINAALSTASITDNMGTVLQDECWSRQK